MPDNATLNQRVQIGMESTWGTNVAATKILKSMTVDVDPQVETDAFFPSGNIFPTSNEVIQEWVEAEMAGILTFTEIIYALAGTFGAVSPTTPAEATLTRQWKWTINGNSILTPKPWSVEKGSSVYASEFSGGIFTGLNFGWSRTDRIEIGGSIMGKQLVAGSSLTNIVSNATVPLVRVLPQQVSIYNDDTWAGLDSAVAYTRAFEAGVSLDGLFAGVWPLNAAITGHDGFVPTQPDSESSLLMMVDATSMGMLDTLRNGDVTYTRIEAVGPEIETDFNYMFRVDITNQVKDIDAFTDHDGVYAVPYTFQPVDDSTNPVIEITVQNTLTAL